jgi:hypothetical protein
MQAKKPCLIFNVAKSDEKELAAEAAIYLPAAPSKIIGFIKNKGLASLDTAVTARGTIPTRATLNTFKGFGFSARKDEAASFLAATAGSQFNLSSHVEYGYWRGDSLPAILCRAFL